MNNFWVHFQHKHVVIFMSEGYFFSYHEVKGQKWFSPVHQCQVPLPTICPCACQPVAFDRASSLIFLQLTRNLLPCSQAKPMAGCSFMSLCSCYVLYATCPSAFPPVPLETLCSFFLIFPSMSSSVLLEHLFIHLKSFHINITASLFVILPTRLQVSRGKGLGFFLFCSLSYWHSAWLIIGHQWINMP